MNVYAIPEVIDDLEHLIDILYDKGYFGCEESSIDYVVDLFNEILNKLPYRLKKRAPKYFEKYGEGLYYAVFPKSKRTQWYVFFKIYRLNGELHYQVRHITNNHIVAQYL